MSEEEKKTGELEAELEAERDSYSKKILEIIRMSKDVDKIAEAQVLMLSFRHILIDKLSKYKTTTFKRKVNDQTYKKMRMEYYKVNYDIKLDAKSMNEYIQADMALRNRSHELLENQIKYFEQCVDTLDKLGYAIKNRIEIENFRIKNN